MRLFYLNIVIAVAELAIATYELLTTRKSFWKDLGRLWYVRGAYLPDSLGIGFDIHFDSLDDFEIAADIGPATLAIGRDFTTIYVA